MLKGVNTMNKELILKLAQTHDSFYLYEGKQMQERIQRLKNAFPGVDFLYSVKCNPHPCVLDLMTQEGFGSDAASLNEVKMSRAHGMAAEDIYYSAPGKSDADLKGAFGECVLIADSLGEIARIEALAAERDMIAEIGVRINPSFAMNGGPGLAGKFGIDEEQFTAEYDRLCALPHVRIVGLHLHVKSQELDPAILRGYYQRAFELAARLGLPLKFLNLGSGIGIPYAPEDRELDIESLGEVVCGLIAEYAARLGNPRMLIETGRYSTGKSGVYVTKVLDRKVSRGKTYIILSNTMNGFVRPSVARMVERAEHAAPCEPLYTGKNAFGMYALTDTAAHETVTLVGNLCTAADEIAADIEMPVLSVGDVLVLTNAGAYAAVLSPMQFASQTPPAQIFLHADGTIEE